MPRFSGMRLAVRFGPPPDLAPPTFGSGSSGSVAENAMLSFAVTVSEICTFTIAGGADAAEFELSSAGPGLSTTLRWASNGTRNFESPADADMDNDYVVQVRAEDASGNTEDHTITITVTDVLEFVSRSFMSASGTFVQYQSTREWMSVEGDYVNEA